MTALLRSFFVLILSFTTVFADETIDHSMEALVEPAAQSIEAGGDLWVQVAKIFFAMASLLAIMVFASYLIKQLTHARHLQMNRSHLIKIREQRALDPKTTLYIVQAHTKSFLIASSSGLIQAIGEVPTLQEHLKENLEEHLEERETEQQAKKSDSI